MGLCGAHCETAMLSHQEVLRRQVGRPFTDGLQGRAESRVMRSASVVDAVDA